MERCLLSSRLSPLRFSEIPRSFPLFSHPKLYLYLSHFSNRKFQTQKDLLHGLGNSPPFFNSVPSRTSLFCTKAVLSPEIPSQNNYSKVAAESTGPIPSNQLLQVVEIAAKTGAEVYSQFLCLYLV